METITRESMLLPEDLAGKRAIHCLSCGQKVGFISYLGPPQRLQSADFGQEDEETKQSLPFKLRLVTLTVNAKLVQGVVGSKQFVRFECECGSVSIYHLIL